MKKGAFGIFLGILFVMLGTIFVFATSWDVAPSTAGAGDDVSVLVFNITNTAGVSGHNLTTVTLLITGNASVGNITSINISDGTNDYSNGSITGTTVTIDVSDVNASALGSTNLTINASLNSLATYGVAFGINITSVGAQANVTVDITTNSSQIFVVETTAPSVSAPVRTGRTTSSITTDFTSSKCSDSGATASGISTCVLSSSSGTVDGNKVTGLSCGTSYTVTITATDNAGNTASAQDSFSTSLCGTSSGTITEPTWTNTYVITEALFEQGYTITDLGAKNRIKFKMNSQDHYVGVLSISGSQVIVEIASDPVQVTLEPGQDAKADLTGNGFYDVYVLLNGVEGSQADMTIRKINERIPEGGEAVGTGDGASNQGEGSQERGGLTWLWVLIIVAVVALLWTRMKKKRKHH